MNPQAAADLVLRMTAARKPAFANTRLVTIDGPGGSGKTTLAAAITDLRPDTVVVHSDDLLPGWEGLWALGDEISRIIGQWRRSGVADYRRFDWEQGRFGERVFAPRRPLVVIEGVGSSQIAWERWTTTKVWLETGHSEQLARAMARGDYSDPEEWRRFEVHADVVFARERTRARADIVIPTPDGSVGL